MKRNQRDSCIAILDELGEMKITKIIADHFKVEKGELKDQIIGEYQANQLASYLKRSILQLRAELENEESWRSLPLNILPLDHGPTKLDVQLSTIKTILESGEILKLEDPMNILIGYQKYFGFWDRSTIRLHDPATINVLEIEEKLSLQYEQVKHSQERESEVIARVENSIAVLDQFVEQKRGELQRIEGLVNTAQSHANEIGAHLNSTTASNEKINSFVEQQSQRIEELKAKIIEADNAFQSHQKSYSEIITEANSAKSNFEAQNENFKTVVVNSEIELNKIKENEKYIKKMFGWAGDYAMSHSFDQRVKRLKVPVIIWGLAVPFSAAGAAIAIFLIFKGMMNVDVVMNLEMFVVNALKTIPFLGLLFFSIKQFSKERATLEEYAFKSAVAITIQAYANILDEDKRSGMIMDSVQKIYQVPNVLSPKQAGLFRSKRRIPSEEIDSIVELVKKQMGLK